jgi:copper-containing nitrite reductase
MTIRNNFNFKHAEIFPAFVLFFAFLLETNVLPAQTTGHAGHAGNTAKLADIVRDPTDVPPSVGNRAPALVKIELTAKEMVGTLDPSAGTTYRYWTFNGKVPGPMIRVRQGDMVEVTLHNDPSSRMTHSIDFHAALGIGGGAAFSQTAPGQSKTFTFQATTPGLFVYHCGTQMIAEHMANGMYGLILVEPPNGLPHVDREYYVMQGEIYTTEPKGKEGLQQFSTANLMDEKPQYFVFNGAVGALTEQHPMPATVGETVRVFFGNAGPNQTSSTHIVGEIFTRVYQLGSLSSPVLTDVQTVGVPSGAAAILEFAARLPGKFAMMDHAISRMAKGNMAVFDVTGPENADLMYPGPAGQEHGSAHGPVISGGMTTTDEASNHEAIPVASAIANGPKTEAAANMEDMSSMMQMPKQTRSPGKKSATKRATTQKSANASPAQTSLNGCLTLAPDGKALLNIFHSANVYRLEAQPFLFSQNASRLVHVTGHFGSVFNVEDPRLSSFVVDAVQPISPSCDTKITVAQIQRTLMKASAATKAIISMTDLGFMPRTLTVNAGERVVWNNSSSVTHNVVADKNKALYRVDIQVPSGAKPFGSEYMQPGKSFSHVFEVPGVYHYVCTLHEVLGMKGVIIVKGPQLLRASK